MKLKVLIPVFLCLEIVLRSQVICIDPGHGYGPNGENLDSRTPEEIFTNCAVGLKLQDILTNSGYTVIMTRTHSDSGSWMSLAQRAELADAYDSDRLLSIHCNGGGGTGTETFWCYRNTPNQAIDSTFSRIVQDYMADMGQWRSRRSIEDFLYLGFHLGVLQGYTPGCLNEIGFVDTPADLEKLLDDNWRNIFAEAYAEAIAKSLETSSVPVYKRGNYPLIIYPNPAKNFLFIENNSSLPFTIRIINKTGIIVKTFSSVNQIDISELKEGTYFLNIIDNCTSRVVKFIKTAN
ncbi:MAG: N-acetylmuramoyl-L-alanine amidase [Bacteroidales bacterium]|nr:N-acetylmuramoyl-L-alanine amidase [Bacteroidales bacterium]